MLEQSNPPAQPTVTPIQFNGKGMEFFRIWIVNIALSIITLGIYSAWAKVRTKQYFYGSTQIRNQSFQYLATGGQILKGRLIAFALFITVQLTVNFVPIVGIFLLLALMVALPWLLNSGMRFNARMTSWRNVRFNFHGTYGKAFVALFVWPVLAMITLGILMPNAVQRSAKYIVNSHSFGNERFDFTALPSNYRKVIWLLMLAYIVIMGLIGIGAVTSL